MKTRKMRLMLEFDVPSGVAFNDIRDFIVDELESAGSYRHPSDPLFHSFGNVAVSKPITPWRDPARKKTQPVTVVKFDVARNRGDNG
jgi:hypothetical protein